MNRLLALLLLTAGCIDASSPVFDNPYDLMGSGDLPVQVTLSPQGAGAQIAWTGADAVKPSATGWLVEGHDCGAAADSKPVETSPALAATATAWTAPGPVPRGGCRDYFVRAVRDSPSRPSAAARLQRPPCTGGNPNGCGGCDTLCADDAQVCSGSTCAACTSAAQCGTGKTCDTTVTPAGCATACIKDIDCGSGRYCDAGNACKACGLSDSTFALQAANLNRC